MNGIGFAAVAITLAFAIWHIYRSETDTPHRYVLTDVVHYDGWRAARIRGDEHGAWVVLDPHCQVMEEIDLRDDPEPAVLACRYAAKAAGFVDEWDPRITTGGTA